MKVRRIIYFFVSVLVLAVGLSSCVVDEKITPIEEDRNIWYNIAPIKTRPQTKAVNEFDKGKTFGSYAYKIPQGKTYDANKGDGDVVTFIDNEEIVLCGTCCRSYVRCLHQ